MKKILFLPLLLITLFCTAQTRTLKGKVVSANDQTAVSKASIAIKNGRSFIADDSGSFNIDVPAGEITLTVSSIGFAQKQIAVGAAENEIIIPLNETDKNLNEVIV